MNQTADTKTATITTAEQLDELPIHATVTDNTGTEWKKFWGGTQGANYWAFRCLGGYSHDSKATSAWLAGYGPLTVTI